MPLTFFMAPNAPRMLATVDAIRAPATRCGLAADGLVYRYDPEAAPDGLPGVEGTFQHVQLLAGGGADPGRADRPDPPG
jgi:GH15 family glucan-1,4-alpha-glucosidase